MVQYEINITEPINKQGVIPDYEIKYTTKDIIEHKDLEMKFVMKRIKELNTTKNKRH